MIYNSKDIFSGDDMMFRPVTLDFAQLIKDRDFDGIIALIISKAPIIIEAIAIIVIGFVASNLIGRLLVKALRLKGVDPSIHSFIRTAVTLIMKFIFILSALSTLNINVNSFIAALSAAVVTAGLGLQSSVSQFASGLQILINHPFRSGDFIDIGSVSGKVQEIRMMYTVLLTLDNTKVIVPNSHITDSNIINYNAEKKRRMMMTFSVSYDTDIEKARRAVLEVADKTELVLSEPEPKVAVKECASSSVELVGIFWCRSTDYYDTFYYMQENVKLAFDEKGISIPYGQLDVHIVKE